MRKMAWALVVFLSLASAVLFLRYVGIDGQLANPKMVQALRQIMAFAHPSPSTAAPAAATVPVMRQQAEFSLYMSIATGLLATLTFIVLAATHQRRPLRRAYDFEDADDDAPQPCPECHEPIKSFELSCRACGYRFGPRFHSDNT